MCLPVPFRQRRITVAVDGLQCHRSFSSIVSVGSQTFSKTRDYRTEAVMLKETEAAENQKKTRAGARRCSCLTAISSEPSADKQ